MRYIASEVNISGYYLNQIYLLNEFTIIYLIKFIK